MKTHSSTLAKFLLATFSAAAVGVAASMEGVNGRYRTIRKPAWNPPDWVFGPVWTALYAFMAVAAWRVWRRDGVREARLPMILFATQLVLNAAWSWIFIGLHRPGAAFAEIVALRPSASSPNSSLAAAEVGEDIMAGLDAAPSEVVHETVLVGEGDEVPLVMGQGHPDSRGNDPDRGRGEKDGEPEGNQESHGIPFQIGLMYQTSRMMVPSPPSTIRFKARLAATHLSLPRSASAKLSSRGKTMVEGTLNGFPFRAALEGHRLKFNKAMREAAGAEPGDTVTVEITRAGDEPEIRRPTDLRKALAGAPRARAVWADITPLARRDWILWICSARQPETRRRRIENACDMLASGKRRVCCFGGMKWLARNHSSAGGLWIPLPILRANPSRPPVA